MQQRPDLSDLHRYTLNPRGYWRFNKGLGKLIIAKDGKWFYSYSHDSELQPAYKRPSIGHDSPEKALDALLQFDFSNICKTLDIDISEVPDNIHNWDYIDDWFICV